MSETRTVLAAFAEQHPEAAPHIEALFSAARAAERRAERACAERDRFAADLVRSEQLLARAQMRLDELPPADPSPHAGGLLRGWLRPGARS